jgi:hypothetical protein
MVVGETLHASNAAWVFALLVSNGIVARQINEEAREGKCRDRL